MELDERSSVIQVWISVQYKFCHSISSFADITYILPVWRTILQKGVVLIPKRATTRISQVLQLVRIRKRYTQGVMTASSVSFNLKIKQKQRNKRFRHTYVRVKSSA